MKDVSIGQGPNNTIACFSMHLDMAYINVSLLTPQAVSLARETTANVQKVHVKSEIMLGHGHQFLGIL